MYLLQVQQEGSGTIKMLMWWQNLHMKELKMWQRHPLENISVQEFVSNELEVDVLA